jgi:hypothetical protein
MELHKNAVAGVRDVGCKGPEECTEVGLATLSKHRENDFRRNAREAGLKRVIGRGSIRPHVSRPSLHCGHLVENQLFEL